MTKRSKGEGSVRKRPDGRWEGRYTLGRDPKTGKQVRKSVYGKSKGEVRKQLTAINAQIDAGHYFEASKDSLSVWLEYWIWNVKKPKIKPKTFDGYLESINTHILGTPLSLVPLGGIRRHHLQTWVDEKTGDGASAYIVRYAYGIIRNSMNDAVRRGLLEFNFADKISLPPVDQNETTILTADEQKIFIDAIKDHRLFAAFYVALTTGIREGELAALTWADFDDNSETLTITKDAIRVNEYGTEAREKTGTKVIVQETPKSRAGRREIPLLPQTATALRKHRIRQYDEKMKNRKLYEDSDLIFCNEIGGLYDPKTFYTWLRKICKATPGLEPIKFHALRHTFATRGLENEMSGKAMQELLGHETEAMTLHYQQLLDKQARIEIDKLKDAF